MFFSDRHKRLRYFDYTDFEKTIIPAVFLWKQNAGIP